jgi:hypothetical protein
MSTTNSQQDGEMFPPDLVSNGYTPTSPDGSVQGDGVVEIPMADGEDKEAHEIPIPDDSEDSWFGDDANVVSGDEGFWEIGFGNGPELGLDAGCDVSFCENPELGEWLLMATDTRKQKVKIQWNTLTEPEKVKFQQAKQKEIKAWVDHKTVCRLAKGTLNDNQIMRCRWIFTWKPPAPGTTEERGKARLVIRGFEDPQLSTISADAPTLTKDGKQLVLQQVASKGWRLINFDIATAFLKGQGDRRKLGIHAPVELQQAIGLQKACWAGRMAGQMPLFCGTELSSKRWRVWVL